MVVLESWKAAALPSAVLRARGRRAVLLESIGTSMGLPAYCRKSSAWDMTRSVSPIAASLTPHGTSRLCKTAHFRNWRRELPIGLSRVPVRGYPPGIYRSVCHWECVSENYGKAFKLRNSLNRQARASSLQS